MAGEILSIKTENSLVTFQDAIREVNDYYRNVEPDPKSVPFDALFDQVELDNRRYIMRSTLEKNKTNNTPETTNELNLSTMMVALQQDTIAKKQIDPYYSIETKQIEKFRLNIGKSYNEYLPLGPLGIRAGSQKASIILSETLAEIQKKVYYPSPPKLIHRGV